MESTRYPLAKLSPFGITSIHSFHPSMVLWWSAAFPGFGHFLLNHYLRGTFLTLSEVLFNSLGHINEAIVFSFCGKFEQAKAILEPRFVLGYLILFLIAMWDSYRLAEYRNKVVTLAKLEHGALPCLQLFTSEVQYVQRKNPLVAALFSFFFPGMGQFYNHRIGLAFYAIAWWWLYLSLSHAHESLILLINGHLTESTQVLRISWLMFMPSVWGGSVYQAYVSAKEHNQLYRMEQRRYLAHNYNSSAVQIFGKSGERA